LSLTPPAAVDLLDRHLSGLPGVDPYGVRQGQREAYDDLLLLLLERIVNHQDRSRYQGYNDHGTYCDV